MNLPLKVDEATGVPTALVIVIAKRDAGKTTLAIALLKNMDVPRDRVVLIDPQGTLAARSGIPRHDIEPTAEAVDAFLEKTLEPAKKEGHGPFFVVDEADRFMTPKGSLGGQGGRLYELLNVSRGWGCGALLLSHGAAVTSKNAIDQADVVFIGNTTEANALDYWKRYLGHPNYVAIVRKLPPHYFMVWSNASAPHQFQGVVTVDEPTGAIREVPESELRRVMGADEEQAAPEAGEVEDGGRPGDPEPLPSAGPPEAG